MNNYISIVILIISLFGISFATIDWCGNIWPLDESNQVSGSDITVYFQIYKAGVTDASSTEPGENIGASLQYRHVGEFTWTSVEMSYNVDVGNNDEFMASIPSDFVITGMDIEVYCEAIDYSDMGTCQGNDQHGNPATESNPLIFHVINPTAIDVMIHFRVNMNGTTVTEPVTVAGTFNGWNPSTIVLSDSDIDGIYEGSYTIPAGSSRFHEYKYINGGVWESSPNRSLSVDDSSPHQYLMLDYWNNRSTRDIYVVFEVDIHGFEIDYDSTFIAGNQPPLHWGWDDGWTESDKIYDDGTHMDRIPGDSIFSTIIMFPAGTYRDIEYKFTTNGRDNEPLPPFQNHRFVLIEDYDTLFLPTVVFGSLANISDRGIPEKVLLYRNYPNPFNSITLIEFDILENLVRPLQLSVHTTDGRLVRRIASGLSRPGHYRFSWDGVDLNNVPMPCGTYIYKLGNGDFVVFGKMVFIK